MVNYFVTKEGFFIKKDGDSQFFIPDDMDNTDRQEMQKWLDAGNELQEEAAYFPSQYDWIGLAIAFKTSQINAILNQLKDEGNNSQINVIWRISDDLTQVVTLPIFSEKERVASMTNGITALFEKLKDGNVPISQSAKDELVEALRINNFKETAEAVGKIKL